MPLRRERHRKDKSVYFINQIFPHFFEKKSVTAIKPVKFGLCSTTNF